MHTRLGCAGRPPRFVVEFYPYANLVSTIRLREDVASVRLSDLLRGEPLRVLEATAAVLLARLYRRPLPASLSRVHREHLLDTRTRRRVHRVRKRRAQRAPAAPRGNHHDLESAFDRLNKAYFKQPLARPHLAWSSRPWRAQLGCFDPALNQILLNSRLDHPRVPRDVVEYILFHEMLHMKHPIRRARRTPARQARCGLEVHSAAFRREERKFRGYTQARRFLARLR